MTTPYNPSFEAENARLRSELARFNGEKIHADNVAFCDSLPGVWPAWREVVIANLDHLAALPEAVEFGEGDGKAPLLDGLRAMLSSLPSPVQFSEYATNERAATGEVRAVEFQAPKGFEVDPLTMELHQKAMKHQKANGGSYEDALRASS